MTPAIFGLEGLAVTASERAFFKDAAPVGYILFGRNVADRDQLRRLTDDLRSISGRSALPIFDRSGGRARGEDAGPSLVELSTGGGF